MFGWNWSKQNQYPVLNMVSSKFWYIFYFECHIVCGFLFPGKKKNKKKKWGGGGWGWERIMWSLESRKTKLVFCLGVKLKQTEWIPMNMMSFKFSYIFYFECHDVCGFLFPEKNNNKKSNLGGEGRVRLPTDYVLQALQKWELCALDT